MSRTLVTDPMEDLALEWIPCGYCHQPAGSWCKTRSGAWAPYLHGARTHPIWSAYRIGYDNSRDHFVRAAISTEPPTQRWWQQLLDEARAAKAAG